MLEIGAFIAIVVLSILIKNKIECSRNDREAKEKIEEKKKAFQDRLDRALERSIR